MTEIKTNKLFHTPHLTSNTPMGYSSTHGAKNKKASIAPTANNKGPD